MWFTVGIIHIRWYSVSDSNIYNNHNDIYKSTFVHSCFMFDGHDLIACLSFSLFFSLVNNWHFFLENIMLFIFVKLWKSFWAGHTIRYYNYDFQLKPIKYCFIIGKSHCCTTNLSRELIKNKTHFTFLINCQTLLLI